MANKLPINILFILISFAIIAVVQCYPLDNFQTHQRIISKNIMIIDSDTHYVGDHGNHDPCPETRDVPYPHIRNPNILRDPGVSFESFEYDDLESLENKNSIKDSSLESDRKKASDEQSVSEGNSSDNLAGYDSRSTKETSYHSKDFENNARSAKQSKESSEYSDCSKTSKAFSSEDSEKSSRSSYQHNDKDKSPCHKSRDSEESSTSFTESISRSSDSGESSDVKKKLNDSKKRNSESYLSEDSAQKESKRESSPHSPKENEKLLAEKLRDASDKTSKTDLGNFTGSLLQNGELHKNTSDHKPKESDSNSPLSSEIKNKSDKYRNNEVRESDDSSAKKNNKLSHNTSNGNPANNKDKSVGDSPLKNDKENGYNFEYDEYDNKSEDGDLHKTSLKNSRDVKNKSFDSPSVDLKKEVNESSSNKSVDAHKPNDKKLQKSGNDLSQLESFKSEPHKKSDKESKSRDSNEKPPTSNKKEKLDDKKKPSKEVDANLKTENKNQGNKGGKGGISNQNDAKSKKMNDNSDKTKDQKKDNGSDREFVLEPPISNNKSEEKLNKIDGTKFVAQDFNDPRSNINYSQPKGNQNINSSVVDIDKTTSSSTGDQPVGADTSGKDKTSSVPEYDQFEDDFVYDIDYNNITDEDEKRKKPKKPKSRIFKEMRIVEKPSKDTNNKPSQKTITMTSPTGLFVTTCKYPQ